MYYEKVGELKCQNFRPRGELRTWKIRNKNVRSLSIDVSSLIISGSGKILQLLQRLWILFKGWFFIYWVILDLYIFHFDTVFLFACIDTAVCDYDFLLNRACLFYYVIHRSFNCVIDYNKFSFIFHLFFIYLLFIFYLFYILIHLFYILIHVFFFLNTN